MALPEEPGFLVDDYGGQILFRPTNADSFLYLVTGPAQSDDGQLQEKILRFRVGGMPSSGIYDLLYVLGLFFFFIPRHRLTNKETSNLNIYNIIWLRSGNHAHGGPSIRNGLRRPQAMRLRCRQASRPILRNC